MDRLDGSDVIVHVVTVTSLPSGINGRTRLAVTDTGQRYVRVELAFRLSWLSRIATLGHELQHACELADSPAMSVDDVRALFMHIGERVPDLDNAFDTRQAIDAGLRVWSDLREHRTTEAVATGTTGGPE
ncbi:MAG: hypothetical protein R2712_20535 [Vicinamibacterales bacterium]